MYKATITCRNMCTQFHKSDFLVYVVFVFCAHVNFWYWSWFYKLSPWLWAKLPQRDGTLFLSEEPKVRGCCGLTISTTMFKDMAVHTDQTGYMWTVEQFLSLGSLGTLKLNRTLRQDTKSQLLCEQVYSVQKEMCVCVALQELFAQSLEVQRYLDRYM